MAEAAKKTNTNKIVMTKGSSQISVAATRQAFYEGLGFKVRTDIKVPAKTNRQMSAEARDKEALGVRR